MMMLHAPSVADDRPQSSMVVIGAANGCDAARRSIAAIGGRVIACLDWDEASTAIADHAATALMIETGGAHDDILATVLPRLDAAAAAFDVPVIIALEARSIDVVAASMLAASVQLLCDPSMSDRVVALAIAAEQRGAIIVSDTIREGEAMRLQRLNEEVARIAKVLSQLTRRDPDERPVAAIVSDHPSPFRHGSSPDMVIDAAEVRRGIRARRMRDQYFGAGLFEDPAWDIITDLFAAELERTQVSVSSLCIAAAVAPTTALRWIAKLTEAGLLERHPDPFDRRRAFMELSPRASHAMREHVGALRRAGLPFG